MFSDWIVIELEINNKRIPGQLKYLESLQNTVNALVKEVLEYFELNEWESTTYQNLHKAQKQGLEGNL